MILKFQKRDSKMVHPLKIVATKSDWEEEEEEQKRGEGRALSHGAIRWKDRNNSFKLLNPYVCYELLMHTHKRIIYDKKIHCKELSKNQ